MPDDLPLIIEGTLLAVTEASVWEVTGAAYRRRPADPRDDGREPDNPALVDGTWHPHAGVWLTTAPDGTSFLRILPTDRPPTALGIHTGTIVRAYTVG